MPPYRAPLWQASFWSVYKSLVINCSQEAGLLRGTCGMRRSGEERLIPVDAWRVFTRLTWLLSPRFWLFIFKNN